MNLIPVAFELTAHIDPDVQCPILAATQELGLEVHTHTYLRQDVRTTNDPTKLAWRPEIGAEWYKLGTNHCLVPAKQGHAGDRKVLDGELWLSRDMEEQSYCLVQCTPEQLLALLTSLTQEGGKLTSDSFRYSDPAVLTVQVGG